jgi:hypothetical protein
VSRARPIYIGDEEIWFDTKGNGEKAKASHLELLALVEDLDLDDLLDEHITQGQIIERLRDALDQNNIPEDVVTRREEWRESRKILPQCRMCGAKDDSTKHHFVNRWILKELQDYAWKWADRNKNCIPLCVRCHRNLHLREGPAKSIVPYLNDREKAFVEAAFEALTRERPHLVVLLARGDEEVYESQLVHDWLKKRFQPSDEGDPVMDPMIAS